MNIKYQKNKQLIKKQLIFLINHQKQLEIFINSQKDSFIFFQLKMQFQFF